MQNPMMRRGAKLVLFFIAGLVFIQPAMFTSRALLAPGGPWSTQDSGPVTFWPALGTAAILWAAALLIAVIAEFVVSRRNRATPNLLRALALIAAVQTGLTVLITPLWSYLGMVLAAILAACVAGLLVWWRWQRWQATAKGPRPGQIWWADVPFEDMDASKDRPCLVMKLDSGTAYVMKITSQDKSDHRGYIRIPTTGWDRRSGKTSWLQLDPLLEVPVSDFRRYAGNCPKQVWNTATAAG